MGLHLMRTAHRQHLAVVQRHHPVGDLVDQRHVVLDHDDGDPEVFLDVLDPEPHPFRLFDVQSGRRFVQQQQFWFDAQGAAQFDSLEFDRYTRFQELTRMLAESVNDVATVQRSLQRNVQLGEDELAAQLAAIMDRFDVIVESSVVGVRKPEARFYEIACELLMVRPEECVFLDDLGVNLKPAAAMGMTTIKVETGPQAIAALEAATGMKLS